MAEVLLVFPPVGSVSGPYISLPVLAGYLKSRGIGVGVLDANCEFYRELLAAQHLQNCRELAADRIESLNGLARLDLPQKYEYVRLVRSLFDTREYGGEMPLLLDHEAEFGPNRRIPAIRAGLRLGCAQWYPEFLEVVETHNIVSYRSACRKFSSRDLLASVESDGMFTGFFERLLPPHLGPDTRIVGISVGFPDQIEAALKCARAARQLAPGVHIVLGGTFISCHMRNVAEPRFFDIVDSLVLDDGEAPLEALVREMRTAEPDLSRVPSLIFRDAGWTIRRTPVAPPVAFAGLPVPDYGVLPLDRYILPRRMMPLLHRVSRGCGWHRCAFCRTELPMISCYETLDGDTVFEQVRGLVESTGCRIFHFTDDSASPEALERFAQRVIAEELEIRWLTNLRFDPRLTMELCALLKQAGCHYVNIGLESYNDRLLRLMRKGTTTQLVDRIVSNCSWGGLPVALYMIVGFPTETEAEARESFARVRGLVENGSAVGAMYSQFNIVPFSDVATHPARYGIRAVHPPQGADLDPPVSHFECDGMDRTTVARLQYEFIETLNALLGFRRVRAAIPDEVPTHRGAVRLRHGLAGIAADLAAGATEWHEVLAQSGSV